MHTKKHLQFNAPRQSLSEHFRAIGDKHQKGKLDHQLHDCLMAGFAMMFFQDPSLLEFQKRLEEKSQFSNLSNVFQVQSVPKDNQLRDTLDQVDTQQLFEIFSDWLTRLQQCCILILTFVLVRVRVIVIGGVLPLFDYDYAHAHEHDLRPNSQFILIKDRFTENCLHIPIRN